MENRKRIILWQTLFSLLILIHGPHPIASHGVPTTSHEVPTTSHEVPTTSHEVPTKSHGVTTMSHGIPTPFKESPAWLSQQDVSSHPETDSPPHTQTQKQINNNDNVDINDEDGDDKLVNAVLLKYGYFREGTTLPLQEGEGRDKRSAKDARHQDTALSTALRRFQSFFGLPLTGVADTATMTLMKKDRCGVADLPDEQREADRPHSLSSDTQSPSDYSLLGSKWHHSTLSWRLDTPSRQLSPRLQRRTMTDAFALWAEVTALKFQHKRSRGSVDIRIGFGRRSHGDQYPFDGKGKVLAHAFGPGETAISGDMHLDNDEHWSLDSEEGSDLFLVAAHELGHSLGLGHSRDPKALMFPYYGYTESLGEDDIRAIQSLYGKRKGKLPVRPKPRQRSRPSTTTPAPSPDSVTFRWAKSATYVDEKPEAGCNIKFDVVFQDGARDSGVYTGIQGNMVYRFTQRGLLAGYPSPLSAAYPGAPSKPDAVFGLPDKSAAYFIKGPRVWRFTQAALDSAYPKLLDMGHFRDTIRFVLPVTDTSGIQRIFVFGRTLWLEYDFDDLPSTAPRTHYIPQAWPDVATDVTYAITGFDGNIYFISPQSHVVMSSFRRTLHGGKRKGRPQWLQSACRLTSGSSYLHSSGSSIFLALVAAFALLVKKC